MILHVAKISYQSVWKLLGDQNFTDTYTHTHTHTHTHLGPFYKCFFLQKCRNKTENGTSAEINDIILNPIEGENMGYWSVDSVLEVDNAVQYPLEVLNTLNTLGFPAHRLILKIGILILLLRNLCPPKLCNGTRIHVTAVQKNEVEATIITGCAKGESVVISRIPLITSNYPFQFKMTQFPINVFCSDNQ